MPLSWEIEPLREAEVSALSRCNSKIKRKPKRTSSDFFQSILTEILAIILMTKGSIVNQQMIMLSHKWEDQVIKWAVNSNIKTLARDRILINSTKEVKGSSRVCTSSVHHTSRQFLQRDTLALSAMKKAIGFTIALRLIQVCKVCRVLCQVCRAWINSSNLKILLCMSISQTHGSSSRKSKRTTGKDPFKLPMTSQKRLSTSIQSLRSSSED